MKTEFSSWDVTEFLQSEEDIAAYLNAAIAEGDSRLVQVALGDVARARGMSEISKRTGLSRENLYRALSRDGNPCMSTVEKVLDAFGLELRFVPKGTGGSL